MDPFQFYYASNLWNWFDPQQPGYDADNVANVEWTNWTSDSATMVAWRNWGSQFRMPTPQPNIASPQLLAKVRTAVVEVVVGLRTWYEKQTPANQALLVAVKIGEEIDVGANYYYYPDGNTIYRRSPQNASGDPTYGLNKTQNLAGGLPALGYNMVQTLGLRMSGGPPTRQEVTAGVQHYFRNALNAAVQTWPLLAAKQMLFAHAGYGWSCCCCQVCPVDGSCSWGFLGVSRDPSYYPYQNVCLSYPLPFSDFQLFFSIESSLCSCRISDPVSDPLLIEWSSPMVSPAVPTYSFYVNPGDIPGEPGLALALQGYDPSGHAFAAGEFFCFACRNQSQWYAAFQAMFNNKYGKLRFASVYNLGPFLKSPGAVAALRQFVDQQE